MVINLQQPASDDATLSGYVAKDAVFACMPIHSFTRDMLHT